jgi:2-dehydropantoate 2-reductase
VSKPKILVLGAGGTGGYFGGRLAESGADVTFLVREGRRKILSEQGLRIESPFGDAQVAVRTVLASEVTPIYDAVILTCKAYDLDVAIASIAPAAGGTGWVSSYTAWANNNRLKRTDEQTITFSRKVVAS